MGASNVAAAYAKYAGKVPPLALNCLVYMALVSKDDDMSPWYGQGHAALAQGALGRPYPLREADIRAVERAMTPLLAAGAIVADRRPSVRRDGHHTVRYRLNLAFTLDLDVPRFPGGVKPSHVPRKTTDVNHGPIDEHQPTDPSHDPQRPTESVRHVPRNPSARPTKSVRTSHENRGSKEEEEPRGASRGTKRDVRTDAYGPRARPTNPQPKCDHGLPATTRADGQPDCALCRRETPCQPTLDSPDAATPPAAPTKTATPAGASAEANASPPNPRRPSSSSTTRTTTTGPHQQGRSRPSAPDPPSPPAPAASPPPPTETATPAAGSPPIVHIRQSAGPTAEAELHETDPKRPHIVKVIYTASRTAAWIDRRRIIESTQEPAA